MRLTPPNSPSVAARKSAGFTLVEMMVAAVIFLALFVTAYVAIELYALRVYTLSASKITATTQARQVLTSFRNNVRTASSEYVGTYANGVFTRAANSTPQIGNALQLQYLDPNNPGTIATRIYYQDSTLIGGNPTNTFNLIDTNGTLTIPLTYMTNYNCFEADDINNNVLTTWSAVQVIHLTMQFVQWEYPLCSVTNNGALDAYDFYRLQTRVVAVP